VSYDQSETDKSLSEKIAEIARSANTSEAQFLAQIFLRRLNSSMYALEQSVRNLLVHKPYFEQMSEFQEDDLEEILKSVITTEIGIDPETANQIIELLEGSSIDMKWEACKNLIQAHGIGESTSAVIFTEFVDTAQYLRHVGSTAGVNTWLITGASRIDERLKVLEVVRNNPTLLITTVVEGLSLTFADRVIHYEVPWDPAALLQRYGRVERVGSQFRDIYHYILVARQPEADAKLKEVLKKLALLENAWR
jgi:SNF2 family DNA or RNA helicase